MFISEFWLGVGVTLASECVALIAYALITGAGNKHHKK